MNTFLFYGESTINVMYIYLSTSKCTILVKIANVLFVVNAANNNDNNNSDFMRIEFEHRFDILKWTFILFKI